jgi:hypothetical protein
MVWICEYPYRTVRLDGPCDDCKCQKETSGAVPDRPGTIGNSEERSTTFGGGGVYGRSAGLGRATVAAGFTPRVLPFRDNK